MVKTVTLPPRPGTPSWDFAMVGKVVSPSGTPPIGDCSLPAVAAAGVPVEPAAGALVSDVAVGFGAAAAVAAEVGWGGAATVGGAAVGAAGVQAASTEVTPVNPRATRRNARRLCMASTPSDLVLIP